MNLKTRRWLLILDVLQLISAIACLSYFGWQLNVALQHRFIDEYHEDWCYPVTRKVAMLDNCILDNSSGGSNNPNPPTIANAYISMWTDDLGRNIVEDPFEAKNSYLKALADQIDVKLKANRTCMCRSNSYSNSASDKINSNPCEAWEICIFNSAFVRHMQNGNSRKFTSTIAFIVGSSLTIIFCIASIAITVVLIRREAQNYTPLVSEELFRQ